MKKALIVFLILAVAGGLFAQTFSGSVKTGTKITFSDPVPVMATADGDDDGAVKASLTFSNGGDDWGVSIGASGKVDTENNVTGISIGDFNGWVKFANIFKLTAGHGGVGSAWGTPGPFGVGFDGSGAGARLEITPIDGLNFGFVLGYPNYGVSAGKIVNFLEETGIGASYDAGILSASTNLKLFSEESTGDGMDANWNFGVKVPLAIFTVMADGYINGLLSDQEIAIGEKIEGSVVGLSYNVWAKEYLVPSPLWLEAGAGLSYGIPISDKAKAEVGADAGLSYKDDEFSFDTWDIYASLTYDFNGNVSTTFLFEIDGDLNAETTTPYLRWTIGYSF